MSYSQRKPKPKELRIGTFKRCRVTPRTSTELIETCELAEIANLLGSTTVQTVRLFVWAVGASTQAEVTPDAVDRFCEVLRLISRRFGTDLQHFGLTVEAAIALAERTNKPRRDEQTILRHRNRIIKAANLALSRLEDRIQPAGWITVSEDEITRIDGWAKHRGFLVIERLGMIRYGKSLETFDLMMERSSSAKALAPALVEEAARTADALPEHGRAFVATRHQDRMLIIMGFWQANQSS